MTKGRVTKLVERSKWFIKLFSKERKKITVEGNNECKETDSINSVQSSQKYHTLCVTLYKVTH